MDLIQAIRHVAEGLSDHNMSRQSAAQELVAIACFTQ